MKTPNADALAIALLFEGEIGTHKAIMYDERMGWGKGTVEEALKSSPFWENRTGPFQAVSSLFDCGYDYDGAKAISEIANRIPSAELGQYSLQARKFLASRIKRASQVGILSIPELAQRSREASAALVEMEGEFLCTASLENVVFVKFQGANGMTSRFVATTKDEILKRWDYFKAAQAMGMANN